MPATPSHYALNRMTVSQLKDLIEEEGLDLPEKPLKKNLVEVVLVNGARKAVVEDEEEDDDDDDENDENALVEQSTEVVAGNKYKNLVTDVFGYISPAVNPSVFGAHYRTVFGVFSIEMFALLICPLPESSKDKSTYDPYVKKFYSPEFHKVFGYWFVFLVILPLVAASVKGDRVSGSSYSNLLFAISRYLVVYLEVPFVSDIFAFLPIKLFTAVCAVLGVLSFWTRVSEPFAVPGYDEELEWGDDDDGDYDDDDDDDDDDGEEE